MMYIKTSKRPGDKRNRTIAMIGSGVLIVIILIQSFSPHFLPAIFTTIARPFWRMEFSVTSGSLDSPTVLLAQNQALKIQLQEIMAKDASVDMLRTQNSEILALFGRSININSDQVISTTSTSTSVSTSNPFNISDLVNTNNRILAAVLVHPPFTSYDELIIDAGGNEGIAVGAKVYAPGNILIGTTNDVLGETSKVILLSSPGKNYPVTIGPGHISATAVGRGGGQYEAQVPQATSIAVGDFVSDTSMSDGVFGKVLSVLNNPADPFETVLFAPPINIYQLSFVLVDSSNSLNVSNITKPVTATKVINKSKK